MMAGTGETGTMFVTMPLGMVKRLPDPASRQRRYWDFMAGQADAEMGAAYAESCPLSLSECQQVAADYASRIGVAETPYFFKEGHTSAVFEFQSLPLIVNVARDLTDASADLVSSFRRLDRAARLRPDIVARVIDISDGMSLDGRRCPVASVERREGLELTQRDGVMGEILRFNGLDEPDIRWISETESAKVVETISSQERLLGVTVTILHGDAIRSADGRIIFVACDGD